jgi:hypothetical protein
MKFISFIFAALLITACNNTKTLNDSFSNKDSELNILKKIPTGNVNTELVGVDPELLKLSLIFTMATARDILWFREYASQFPEDEPIPYHERIKMDKESFEKYQALKTNSEYVSTGTQKVKIIKRKGLIKFKTSGELDLLNDLVIYTDSFFVKINNCKLNFISNIFVTDEKNIFKSKWAGYKFSYVLPIDVAGKSTQEILQMDMKSYTLTISQIENTEKIFLDIEAIEKDKTGFKPRVSIKALF